MARPRIKFKYPEVLLQTFDEAALWRIAREAFSVRVYQLGAISLDRAGAALGINRATFLTLLDAFGVSPVEEAIAVAIEVVDDLLDDEPEWP
jgi:hypothetical protein